MSIAKQLDDIMECPICTEVYTDPRVLPCVHTYCLKCIKAWSRDKQLGDQLACPLCRKQFTVPCDGVGICPKIFSLPTSCRLKRYLVLRVGRVHVRLAVVVNSMKLRFRMKLKFTVLNAR